MSARTRLRILLVNLATLVISVATWVLGGWSWWRVAVIALAALGAGMAVARPYVVGPDDGEAGEGGRG